MLAGKYQNIQTGEIRYVMQEAYGVGPLVGRLICVSCDKDGADHQAHVKSDFLLKHAEVTRDAV